MSRWSSGLGQNSKDAFRDPDGPQVAAVVSDVGDDETYLFLLTNYQRTN